MKTRIAAAAAALLMLSDPAFAALVHVWAIQHLAPCAGTQFTYNQCPIQTQWPRGVGGAFRTVPGIFPSAGACQLALARDGWDRSKYRCVPAQMMAGY